MAALLLAFVAAIDVEEKEDSFGWNRRVTTAVVRQRVLKFGSLFVESGIDEVMVFSFGRQVNCWKSPKHP